MLEGVVSHNRWYSSPLVIGLVEFNGACMLLQIFNLGRENPAVNSTWSNLPYIIDKIFWGEKDILCLLLYRLHKTKAKKNHMGPSFGGGENMVLQ